MSETVRGRMRKRATLCLTGERVEIEIEVEVEIVSAVSLRSLWTGKRRESL